LLQRKIQAQREHQGKKSQPNQVLEQAGVVELKDVVVNDVQCGYTLPICGFYKPSTKALAPGIGPKSNIRPQKGLIFSQWNNLSGGVESAFASIDSAPQFYSSILETSMKKKLLYIVVLHALLCGPALAKDSLSCRGKIIDIGMKMEDVRTHCGAPNYSSIDNQAVHAGNRITGTTPVTTWHYNQPGGQIIAVLVFDVDKLRSIEYIDKMDDDLQVES